MAAMVLNRVPIIDVGAISFDSKFQLFCSLKGWYKLDFVSCSYLYYDKIKTSKKDFSKKHYYNLKHMAPLIGIVNK